MSSFFKRLSGFPCHQPNRQHRRTPTLTQTHPLDCNQQLAIRPRLVLFYSLQYISVKHIQFWDGRSLPPTHRGPGPQYYDSLGHRGTDVLLRCARIPPISEGFHSDPMVISSHQKSPKHNLNTATCHTDTCHTTVTLVYIIIYNTNIYI